MEKFVAIKSMMANFCVMMENIDNLVGTLLGN
jgi:hypothetical protein